MFEKHRCVRTPVEDVPPLGGRSCARTWSLCPCVEVPLSRVACFAGPRRIVVLKAPVPPAAAAEGPARVVGWCTFAGCREGFASWEQHVEHYKRRHIHSPNGRAVCSACLVQVLNYEGHMLSHKKSRHNCGQCSASFVNQDALGLHRSQFHRRGPPQTQQAAAAGSAATAGATKPASASTVLGWCTFLGCAQSFPSWERFVSHCKVRHDPSLCSLCLQVHKEPHGQGDLQCSWCPAHFLGSVGLTVHKNLFHRVGDDSPLPGGHVPAPRMPRLPAALPRAARAVIGWCTSPRCDQPFRSWEDHVKHHKNHHARSQVAQSAQSGVVSAG